MKKIIKKIFPEKHGSKLNWLQSLPYKLGDDNKPFPFEVQILDRNNEVLERTVVNIPGDVLQNWSDDSTITNYILTALGLHLDTDNSTDLAIEKLNGGTITYASGDQTENDNILKNYVTLIESQLQQYKDGDIEIDDFLELEGYSLNISVDSQNFTLKNFIKSLVPLNGTDKTTKLNECITALDLEP